MLHLPRASALVTILGPLQGLPLRLVCSIVVKGSALRDFTAFRRVWQPGSTELASNPVGARQRAPPASFAYSALHSFPRQSVTHQDKLKDSVTSRVLARLIMLLLSQVYQ